MLSPLMPSHPVLEDYPPLLLHLLLLPYPISNSYHDRGTSGSSGALVNNLLRGPQLLLLQTSYSNLGEIRLEQCWSGFGDDLTSSLRDSLAPTDVARGNCKGAEDASVSNNPGQKVCACQS